MVDRGLGPSNVDKGYPQIAVNDGVFRLELQGLFEMLNGQARLFEAHQSLTQVVVSPGANRGGAAECVENRSLPRRSRQHEIAPFQDRCTPRQRSNPARSAASRVMIASSFRSERAKARANCRRRSAASCPFASALFELLNSLCDATFIHQRESQVMSDSPLVVEVGLNPQRVLKHRDRLFVAAVQCQRCAELHTSFCFVVRRVFRCFFKLMNRFRQSTGIEVCDPQIQVRNVVLPAAYRLRLAKSSQ